MFLNHTDQDRAAIQPVINQIAMYPLGQFDGTPKAIDWRNARVSPAPEAGQGEVRFVFPERFAADLRAVLAEVPPLPGEEALYALLASVLDAVAGDDGFQAAFVAAAQDAEAELVTPLFQFHHYGLQLPHH